MNNIIGPMCDGDASVRMGAEGGVGGSSRVYTM